MKFKTKISHMLINILPFGIFFIACLWFITIPTIGSLLSKEQSIPIYDLIESFAATLLFFGEEFYLCYNYFVESSVGFSETEIRKGGIKTTTIKWNEIISIKRWRSTIYFQSATKTIRVYLSIYKEPQKVFDYIVEQYLKTKTINENFIEQQEQIS